MTTSVLGFLAAVLPLVATPGASLALLVRHVAVGGRRRAAAVMLGTASGLAAHATLAVAGLSAVVMHSAEAFTAVRLAGALYLVGLGLWCLRPDRCRTRPGHPRRLGRSAYGQAFLGNLLNPKAASIYLTVLPQFIDPHRSVVPQIAILAGAHAVLVTSWLAVWTALLGPASRALRAAGVRAALDRATGLILIALGVRAAAA
ncbi:LysE family translocator [Kitasatospora sp. NBC_01539]|uniref:LysE family translocator n=1 Tax=Kitasatospora sp. NBC_01539 TaxID=2903577 RepID=UPI0038600D10